MYFPGEKKKKFVVNKVLWIVSYQNVKARALGHLKNEQALSQLGKKYSPSNIYNLNVKRRLFFRQNEKLKIIQILNCITKLNNSFCINNVQASTFHF